MLAAASFVVSACASANTPAAAPPVSVAAVPAPAPLTAVTLAEDIPGNKTTYTVPAVAVTRDGTIVVAYDARHGSARDLPNNIDIVERRSTDNGVTWTSQTVIVAHSGGNTPSTASGVGDSSLLYDYTNGRLFLFYDYSPARVSIFSSSTSTTPLFSTSKAPLAETTVHPMLRYSDDNGATWSSPIDLIEQLKRPNMTGIFAGSGHGFQATDGTLLQPYSYFIGGVERAAIAYSTDHGTTWHMSPEIGTHLSESKIVQLNTGALLDDARPTVPGYRKFSHANCVTCRWSPPTSVTAIPDPVVNGDLIRVGLHPTWLLESNPDSQIARVRLTIRLSMDNGATWRHTLPVTSGSAGYSTMTQLPDGDYAIVYATAHALIFQRFALSQITGPLPERTTSI